jgi:hypothetical protein
MQLKVNQEHFDLVMTGPVMFAATTHGSNLDKAEVTNGETYEGLIHLTIYGEHRESDSKAGLDLIALPIKLTIDDGKIKGKVNTQYMKSLANDFDSNDWNEGYWGEDDEGYDDMISVFYNNFWVNINDIAKIIETNFDTIFTLKG